MYTYKGNQYNLRGEIIPIKNPVTREWFDAIIYRSMKDGKSYGREKSEFFNLFKPVDKVPFHVQAISKIYPVLKTEGNLAMGEIRKFLFVESQKGQFPIGRRINSTEFIANEDYDAIWIHVGGDYFKLIGLWEARTC